LSYSSLNSDIFWNWLEKNSVKITFNLGEKEFEELILISSHRKSPQRER
jgi:hypothetical protein